MRELFVQDTFCPGEFGNYLVAGKLCNAFAVGNVGAADDFYLVGAEATDESPYPIVTGVVLDAAGQVLFRLKRNVLTGDCRKVMGDFIGYEIHNALGKKVFSIRTEFRSDKAIDGSPWVTTIEGTFYGKQGDQLLVARSGGTDESIEGSCNAIFGFQNGKFGLYAADCKEEFIRSVFESRGVICEEVTGEISGGVLELEGKALIGATVSDAQVIVRSGKFGVFGGNNLKRCHIEFVDEAKRIRDLIYAMGRKS